MVSPIVQSVAIEPEALAGTHEYRARNQTLPRLGPPKRGRWRRIGTAALSVAGIAAAVTMLLRRPADEVDSSTLDYPGLVPALQKLVGEFSARHGIVVNFGHDAVPARLPSDVALSLFRVTEESLTNTAKHSQARSACVQVKGASDGLRLTIEDSGAGFDLDHLEARAGLGFVSMRERLRVLRGTVHVDSPPSRGTRVDAWVPAAGVATCRT